MRELSRFVVASALICGVACGAEPEPSQPQSDPPPPVLTEPSRPVAPPPTPPAAEGYEDCTRGRQQRGLLAGLPAYHLEYGPEYSEVERARTEAGFVSISYSGCDHFVREYRFELPEALGAGETALVFARAAELMRTLADDVSSRALRVAARQIEELSASGSFALGDDLTGEWFEGDYGIAVRLEAGGSVVAIVQTFIL